MKMRTRSVATIRFAAAVFAALFLFVRSRVRRPALDLPPNRYRQRQIASVDQPRLESYGRRILRHAKSDSRHARDSRLRRASLRAHGDTSPRNSLCPNDRRKSQRNCSQSSMPAQLREIRPHADALAWFDAGYFAEAYKNGSQAGGPTIRQPAMTATPGWKKPFRCAATTRRWNSPPRSSSSQRPTCPTKSTSKSHRRLEIRSAAGAESILPIPTAAKLRR